MQLREERFLQRPGMADHKPCPMTRMSSFEPIQDERICLMVINTNIAAMASQRSLASSTTHLAKSLSRLSSGSKIVSPEDDAAGLAQSMRFEAQINRNSAVRANLGNAVSFVQTQDGFLQKVQAS
ncbi:MAG TPA: flagellin, partial [Verrucomicrobiota bacterium]|nr:flagellin [Verrucomicrobiota bacterium]